jgi:pyrroloquinoline quinone biosynthesis protein D
VNVSLLNRNSEIIWRVEKQREAEVVKALESGADPGDQGTVLLIVSGTMHQLNMIGGTIWQLADGSRSTDQIVEQLADEYDVERSELEADVYTFVDDLMQRGWLNND